jgi:hypothetical protein
MSLSPFYCILCSLQRYEEKDRLYTITIAYKEVELNSCKYAYDK